MAIKVGTVSDPALFGKLVSGGWYQNKSLRAIGMTILKEANFTCKACGFVSRPSEEVPHAWMLPIDVAHPGFVAAKKGRGRCLCPFCASSMAINWAVSPQQSGSKAEPAPGRLIFFPEVSQESLNRLASYIVSISSARAGVQQGAVESAARDIDAAIMARQADLQQAVPVFREGMDYEFAHALALVSSEYYDLRADVIGGVRWWPHYKHWVEQGYYWSKATFKPLTTK